MTEAETERERVIECAGHREQYEWDYPVLRCTHIGQRFVVEIRAYDRLAFIDYVEDVGGGLDGITVEGHTWDWEDVEGRDALYERLTAKMAAGEPPDASW